MSVKFFGQFLLERGIITPAQLLASVAYQEENNLKFGDYVRGRGYLQDVEIRRLNEEQKSTDLRIGELAVKLGLLSAEQVTEIVTLQQNDHMFIGEALVKKGFLTHEALVVELERFREDQRQYMPGEISIPDGVTQGETMRDIVDLTVKMLRRIAHMQVKVGLGLVMAEEPPRAFRAIAIAFRGSVKVEYMLLVDRYSAVQIAGGMLAADASAEDDDSIVDGVKEFANIACGNIMALLAKKGRTLDISPPREEIYHIDGYNILRGRRAVNFPLVTAEGEITLILAEG